MVDCLHYTYNEEITMSNKTNKKNNNKSATEKFLDGLRIPIAPPSITFTDKQEKRKKKFDYRKELNHY